MTGPEHFWKMEDILSEAFEELDVIEKTYLVSLAQVHAIAALTLATLDSKGAGAQIIQGSEWREAIERGSATVNA